MARSAENYLRLLQSLLPRGRAWNREEDSNLTEFLYGEAEEFARVEERSNSLLQERDTRKTSELLVDHENDLGLPDECSDPDATIQERRFIAHTKLITLGGQNPQYFIDLAEAYGWTITITEYSPFWCGIHGCGDPCGDQWVIFYWNVTINFGGGEIIYFTCGSSECGDPLAYIPGTSSLICMLNKYKPAHTVLTFDYDGPGFDTGFDSGFDSMPSGNEDYLTGGFSKGFSLGFDVCLGGGFSKDGFDSGFDVPA